MSDENLHAQFFKRGWDAAKEDSRDEIDRLRTEMELIREQRNALRARLVRELQDRPDVPVVVVVVERIGGEDEAEAGWIAVAAVGEVGCE